MKWTKESALRFLSEKNPYFDDFINKGLSCLHYHERGVDFLIYQENWKAHFYFAVPHVDDADYNCIYDLIDACQDELNRLLTKAQDERTGI